MKQGQLDCVVLAAELSRALLLPERARQILDNHYREYQRPKHARFTPIIMLFALRQLLKTEKKSRLPIISVKP